MRSKIRAQPVVQTGRAAPLASGFSFIFSLVTAGILSYFVNALRRAYMSVPWPIVLVMSASCLNISAVFITSVLRCVSPSSIILRLALHLPIAILWVTAVVLLGFELGANLIQACPAADAFGNDMAVACRLFKALFSFTVLSSVCSSLLVIFDALSLNRLRKATAYTAMAKNTGGANAQTPGYMGRKDELGMLTGILRRRDKNMYQDERSIMLNDINLEEKDNSMLGPGSSAVSLSLPRLRVPSPEWGPRGDIHAGISRTAWQTSIRSTMLATG